MSAVHPSWCDPRCCLASASNLHHRVAPLSFKLADDDRHVAVGLSRCDEVGMFNITGPLLIDLVVGETEYPAPGDEWAKDSALTAADARLLAAALISAADQLEAQTVAS